MNGLKALHEMPRVESVKVVAPHTAEMTFADKAQKRINFLPVLRGEVYGSFFDAAMFETIAADKGVHTIV